MKKLTERVLREAQSAEREYGSIYNSPDDCEQLQMTHYLLSKQPRHYKKVKPLTDQEISIAYEYLTTQETIADTAHKYHHAPNSIRSYVQKYQREVSPHPSSKENSGMDE